MAANGDGGLGGQPGGPTAAQLAQYRQLQQMQQQQQQRLQQQQLYQQQQQQQQQPFSTPYQQQPSAAPPFLNSSQAPGMVDGQAAWRNGYAQPPGPSTAAARPDAMAASPPQARAARPVPASQPRFTAEQERKMVETLNSLQQRGMNVNDPTYAGLLRLWNERSLVNSSAVSMETARHAQAMVRWRRQHAFA